MLLLGKGALPKQIWGNIFKALSHIWYPNVFDVRDCFLWVSVALFLIHPFRAVDAGDSLGDAHMDEGSV